MIAQVEVTLQAADAADEKVSEIKALIAKGEAWMKENPGHAAGMQRLAQRRGELVAAQLKADAAFARFEKALAEYKESAA